MPNRWNILEYVIWPWLQESTYGTHIHEKREDREARFTGLVHDIVNRGGRCLIPVFALGRAQELLLILGKLWIVPPFSTFLNGCGYKCQIFLKTSFTHRKALLMITGFTQVLFPAFLWLKGWLLAYMWNILKYKIKKIISWIIKSNDWFALYRLLEKLRFITSVTLQIEDHEVPFLHIGTKIISHKCCYYAVNVNHVTYSTVLFCFW